MTPSSLKIELENAIERTLGRLSTMLYPELAIDIQILLSAAKSSIALQRTLEEEQAKGQEVWEYLCSINPDNGYLNVLEAVIQQRHIETRLRDDKKSLEEEVNVWKQICKNRDATVNQQDEEWVKLRNQIDSINQELSQLKASSIPREVGEKAIALINRMKEVYDNPHYIAVWESYQNHGGDYSQGPQWVNEFEALEKCIAQQHSLGKEAKE